MATLASLEPVAIKCVSPGFHATQLMSSLCRPRHCRRALSTLGEAASGEARGDGATTHLRRRATACTSVPEQEGAVCRDAAQPALICGVKRHVLHRALRA